MQLTEGTKLCGFTVKRARKVEELNADFYEMTHDKTGSELCWVDNKEENKLFSVTFKTLPENDTGVFHILEHSVLCGSEKYPVKEPFVDLLKSSMNTFLNAMTYPDKTVYPVSSRNAHDFLNLTAVYLDAVFAPRLTEDPNVFYQEGIHTEEENGISSYKGVVFNEMKGAMSDIDSRIEQGISQLLFPDTCYRFNSGGDPAAIPDLTYEAYKKTYETFYTPQNARFFLDGDVPLQETLTMIDSYLQQYDGGEENRQSAEFLELPLQKPVTQEGILTYEIPENEDETKKAAFVFGKIIGTWQEREKILAAKILCDMLADTNESPLKRAILSSGLAEDMEMTVASGVAQPYLLIIARNIKDGDSQKIRELITRTAEELTEKGFGKEIAEASINRFAFRVKQTPEPQGLYRSVAAQNSWLYGGDPLQYLLYDEAIKTLREMAADKGFERLLKELLLEPDGVSLLHMLPSKTLGKEERAAEAARLKQETKKRSAKQREELQEQNKKLTAWQQTPDSPEASATIPMLSLEEVSPDCSLTKTIVKSENGVTVLSHPVATHGIVYLTMYFSLTNYSLPELTQLTLLSEFFGELPTASYSAAELQKQIKSTIGSLSFRLGSAAKNKQTETCKPYFQVRAGLLKEKLAEAKTLLYEILTQTKFDDSDKIREIVLQVDDASRQAAIGNGHALAVSAVRAHYTANAAVHEATEGYTFLKFQHDLAKNFETMAEDFLSLLRRATKEFFCRAHLTVSVTGPEETEISDLVSAFPQGEPAPENARYQTGLPERMGIRIPAQTAFAVKGYHLSRCQTDVSGSLRVAANILTLGFLWNQIRVQGGAYGAGFPVSRDGSVLCYSYRDPSPEKSLKIYDQTAEFIREICQSDENLDKFIISALAATEPLISPEEEGLVADERWLSGVTEEDMKTLRQQILSADREQLNAWCKALETMAQNGAVCVVGHQDALNRCENLEIFEL